MAQTALSLSPSGTAYRLSQRGGRLVVLIHGIGAGSFHFDGLAGALERAGFRVLAYDLLGRGGSLPEPSDDYGAEAHVAQLQVLLKELGLGLERFDVVGHSMGGALAALVADRLEGAQSVVLLSPAGLMPLGPLRAVRACACIQPLVARALRSGSERAWRDDWYRQTGAEGAAMEACAQKLRAMHAANPHAHHAFFQTALQFPLSGLQPTVQHVAARKGRRILLMWGRQDKAVPFSPSFKRWEAALGAGAAMFDSEVVEEAAHGFFMEKAAVVEARIVAFLSRGA